MPQCRENRKRRLKKAHWRYRMKLYGRRLMREGKRQPELVKAMDLAFWATNTDPALGINYWITPKKK